MYIGSYIWKQKNETCQNYSRNGGGGIRENDGWGEINYISRTFITVTIYPSTSIIW
jgi:hypothetical protein